VKLGAGLAFFGVGVVLALAIAQTLVTSGRPFPASPSSFVFTLGFLGPVIFALTLPVRRYQHRLRQFEEGKSARPERLNPFYAFRVLVLSRAGGLAGAGFMGWHIGLFAALAILGSANSMLTSGLTWGASASVSLAAFAIAAEHNCKVPKDRTPPDGAAA
jgi:hypothetical protein